MKRLTLIFSISLILACKEEKRYHDVESSKLETVKSDKLDGILAFQEELNSEYKNPETSPLPDRYRKNFESLSFFPADTNYVIIAEFVRTPDALPFSMSTTTERESIEVVYGIAKFKLHGKNVELEIYQSPELIVEEKYKEYLFLPFTDETNGEETYGGGRYLDLTIPNGNQIELDFNKSYNPYCVYNKKYSCPLVPSVNAIQTKIMAGVKDF